MARLSIITINLNDCAGLQRTLQSVIGQTFSDYEYLVIDGESSDGSKDILALYSHFIHYWVSEPDKGIYNAMNKGIRAATGEYCLFLNSGDWLADNSILAQVFSMPPTEDIVAGDVYYYDSALQQIKWKISSPCTLTARTLFAGSLPHQATFIRRSLFDTIGLYDEHLKIASDWLFFLKALLDKGCTYQRFWGVVSYFNMEGISCDPSTSALRDEEKKAVLLCKYPRFVADYEQLELLENQISQWTQSREYPVYKAFYRVGLINLGVWVRRGVRFFKRTILQTT